MLKLETCLNMFLYVYFNKYTSKCIHPRILKHTSLFKKEEDKAPPCQMLLPLLVV